MFLEIRNMIAEDNDRNAVKRSITLPNRSSLPGSEPRSTRDAVLSTGTPRPLSMPDSPVATRGYLDELFLDQSDIHDTPQMSVDRVAIVHDNHHRSSLAKTRPVVRPKPNGLQARERSPVPSAYSAVDNLEQRFSQLRVQRKVVHVQGTEDSHNVTLDRGGILPSTTEYSNFRDGLLLPNDHIPADFSTISTSGKPYGPREMPSSAATPPHPPKLPLDARQAASFPRAPSPAYDPSRAGPAIVQLTTQLKQDRKPAPIVTDALSAVPKFPPRVSEANTISEDSRLNGASRPSYEHRAIPTSPPRIPNVPERPWAADPLRTKTITAVELKEQLRSSKVLVIDVRSRQEYDQGHVFASSVICIEPVGLRLGMSADELEDRLVVSPQVEQNLFERRNEFDLVVYYDQETRSNRFLDGPPTNHDASTLRALYDCLYEFNLDKPLRHPPVLLLGGLEAWMDFMTPQSLAVSQTAAQMASARTQNPTGRPGRPIGRVRMASANSSLEVRRRRLREYNPLNADEEKTWLEKARTEGVQSADYSQAQSDSDTESSSSQSQEPPSPFVHSYDEFLRRFPEHPSVQQSMTTSSRSSVPSPPSRTAPSMPSVPSRPPPAVPRPSYSGVSERESSPFSPTSRQLPLVQPPLYTGRAVSHHRKLPRTGLVNFSVTCYMNATIQCLLATLPLSHFFLDDKWRDMTQKNWKGSQGIMPEIYANLMRDLWRGDKKSIRPASFRKFCARLNGEWGVDRQQDAKEFFDFLVDCLHEDLNANWHRSQLQPLTVEQELYREKLSPHYVSLTEWSRYAHREQSYISDLFAGQHASKLRCTTCKHTSTTHEAFYSISVEIPRSGKGDIYDCLRSYCKEERLGRGELWKCPYCKCEREATKQITITRAPKVLVVHFKRFSASKNETARKVHTPINFPLHQLNIGPYMLPSLSPNKHEATANAERGDPAITPPFVYDCYAVMRHLGTSLSGGHYIALVRDYARSCWRKFDDEYSSDFDPSKSRSEQRLQNEQAYLVFYIRAPAR